MTTNTLLSYDHIFPNEFLDKIYAHKDQKGEYESLKEHSKRTLDKAQDIISQLQLENILTNLNSGLYKEILEIYPEQCITKITEDEFCLAMKRLLRTIIYLHDIGKVNKKYQLERLGSNSSGIAGFSDSHHSFYGHMIINQFLFSKKENTIFRKIDQLGFCAIVLTTIVNRHHTPLIDMTISAAVNNSYRTRSIWDKYEENLEKNMHGFENACKQTSLGYFDKEVELDNKKIYLERTEIMGKIPPSMFLIYKLWYSILVQADCLATEMFFSKTDPKVNFIDGKLAEELENKFYSVKEYNRDLEKKKHILSSPIEKIEDINELRTRILLESSKTLKENKGKRIFYLDAPTGGGKTNTSIKLALDLVKIKNLCRINYVFPFVNIIEQNHKEIEDTLGQEGDETVSKIYHLSDWGFETEKEEENFNLRNQKFLNYPINVISNVNFFNIFLKSSKKATMKTLEICNSVVILDEIQSLPNKKWVYFVTLLNMISKCYNAHFIIMSATLPDLGLLFSDSEKKEFEPVNLIKKPEQYAKHQLMKRVTYQIKKKAKPENEIQEILKTFKKIISNKYYKKILIVVNSISDSIKIYKNVTQTQGFRTFLLNSTTLPHKKKEIIEEIKKDQKIILVSTQSVEAGVDIDCDVGIRADAPLDSIEQVAGRVNRNGKKPLTLSKLFVIPSQSKKYVYSGDIRNMFDISGTNGLDCEKLLMERDFSSYYQFIMDRVTQKEEITKKNKTELLDPMNSLEFNKLNKSNYIESSTFSIFLPIEIESKYFGRHRAFIEQAHLESNGYVIGDTVWKLYKETKSSKSVTEQQIKKIQLLAQGFCVNLSELKGVNKPWTFREFIHTTLQQTQEDDEPIIKANKEFVDKYFNNNFGLDIQKLKNDFKQLRDVNFI